MGGRTWWSISDLRLFQLRSRRQLLHVAGSQESSGVGRSKRVLLFDRSGSANTASDIGLVLVSSLVEGDEEK